MVRRIDALLWGEPVDGLPASSASVEATFLDSIVGTYALASGGRFDVRRQEEGLVVRAADRSVATLFVGTPIPPSDDRLRDLRSNAPMIVEAMGQGNFAPYRSVYQSDGPDFGGEVSFWTEAFESWGKRFGAIKAVRLLGGGELGGRLVGIVVIEYESNIRFVGFERQADGRYFIFVDGGAWLTTRRRFLPVEAGEFVSYDFLLGTACRMHVVRSAEGHVSGLRVGCPTEEEGGVVARKLASH